MCFFLGILALRRATDITPLLFVIVSQVLMFTFDKSQSYFSPSVSSCSSLPCLLRLPHVSF